MKSKQQRELVRGVREVSGMILLEVLGYALILSLVVALCLQVFLSSSRLAAVGGNAVDRIENLATLQNDFRQVIRESGGVAADVAGFSSGEKQVVLRMPDGERYVIFGALDGVHRLSKRTIRVEGGAWDLERVETYPIDLSDIRFSYAGAGPGASRWVTLRVTAAGRARDNRAGKDVTVTATPRGRARASEGQSS